MPGSMPRADDEPPFIGSADWMRLPLTAVPGFCDLAAVSRRDHHPSGAGRVSGGAQFPPHDRDPGVSRHQLVRHLSDQRTGGIQRYPSARRQSEAVDRAERALFRLPEQFLAAGPVFRVVRLLAEGRADRHHGRAGGVLFAARLGRGPRNLCPERLALCRALAAAETPGRGGSICGATAASAARAGGRAARLSIRPAPADPEPRAGAIC